ncbi:hypothetical protein AVEN_96967-1 [Araneus ventricosus]|uniref:Uncharacterized protein n=1 Tax=Araneus ventricosus TaxID=182803 RepID=A0A4Y2CHZ4_ARAVE|nr:hypothetical protein AVEN_96967-1 [Araneus ventricosus]
MSVTKSHKNWHVFLTVGRECAKKLARLQDSRPQRVKPCSHGTWLDKPRIDRGSYCGLWSMEFRPVAPSSRHVAWQTSSRSRFVLRSVVAGIPTSRAVLTVRGLTNLSETFD